MFLLDRLLISGLGFVFDKVATAVDGEMNDEDRLRSELLSAGMQLESGELSEEAYEELEAHLRRQQLLAQGSIVVQLGVDDGRDLVEHEPQAADQQ